MKTSNEIFSEIKLSPVWDKEWRLLEDFSFVWETVPKGFIFDWASIPRIFWILGTPMWIDTLVGALIHDWLYKTHKYTRQESDEKFNQIMIYFRVRFLKRVMFFIWVRIWWWVAWCFPKK